MCNSNTSRLIAEVFTIPASAITVDNDTTLTLSNIVSNSANITIDSDIIDISKPGTYEITVYASVEATIAGDVKLAIMANDVAVPRAFSVVTIDTVGDKATLAMSVIKTVEPSPVSTNTAGISVYSYDSFDLLGLNIIIKEL